MKVYDGSTTETEAETATATSPERVKVCIAEHSVASGEAVLTTSGLGSCVGVAIYDASASVAGLVHAMLPSQDEMDETGNDAKFADAGIRRLVTELEREGAEQARRRWCSTARAARPSPRRWSPAVWPTRRWPGRASRRSATS